MFDDESGPGMPKVLHCFDDGLAVVCYLPVLKAISRSVCLQEDVTGPQIGEDRVAHAAHVHDTCSPDCNVHRLVSMTGKDEIRVTVAEEMCQFRGSQTRIESDPVIAPWRGVDTQNFCVIWQGDTHFER